MLVVVFILLNETEISSIYNYHNNSSMYDSIGFCSMFCWESVRWAQSNEWFMLETAQYDNR